LRIFLFFGRNAAKNADFCKRSAKDWLNQTSNEATGQTLVKNLYLRFFIGSGYWLEFWGIYGMILGDA
jgi:hypothetical protein